ncbi:MAG: DUF2339 domain-containing protein, partial [Planctomycetota bacterium]
MELFYFLRPLLILGAAVLGVIAFVIVVRLRRTVEDNERFLSELSRRLRSIEDRLRRPGAERTAEPPEPQAPPPPLLTAYEETLSRLRAAKAAADAGIAPPKDDTAKVEPARPEPVTAPEPATAPPPATPPEPEPPAPIEPAEVPPAKSDWWRNLEEKAGKVWLTWAGAFILILSAGFLAKYAFDQGWLGPLARVIAGVACGLAAVAAGERFFRRGMKPLGQGLLGAGIAITYVSLFAAYMALAVLHDALPVSILATLGAFLTPVILRTGTDQRDILFAYLLIVDLGVLGVSLFRRWRALDMVAFAGTWILYAGWYLEYYSAAAMAPAIAWIGAFYAVFLAVPFANHMREKTHLTLERFLMALANALVSFSLLYFILRAQHRLALSLATLGMAAVYVAAGVLTRLRIPEDKASLFGFMALAVGFATASPPLYLKVNWTTVAWAVEAPVLLYLAYRYRYVPIRAFAFVVLALLFARFFITRWPLHDSSFELFINIEFATAMCVAVSGAIFAALHHRCRREGSPADRGMKLAAAIAAGLFLVLILDGEMVKWREFQGNFELARATRAAVWAAGAFGFIIAGSASRSVPVRFAASVPLLVAAAAGTRQYVYDAHYPLLLNVRFGSALLAACAFILFGLAPQRRRDGTSAVARDKLSLAAIFGWLCVLAAVHAELHLFFDRAGLLQRGEAIAVIVYAVGGLALLFVGVRLDNIPARIAASLPLAFGCLISAALVIRRDATGPLFANLTFIAGLAAVLAVFAFGFTLKYCRLALTEGERRFGLAVRVAATVLLPLLLSAEVRSYCLGTALPADSARWAAAMSVSLVWALYAMAMLSVGFWRNTTSLR